MGALDAGAVGYLLKDASAEDVVKGIRAAVEGGSPLDPRAARMLLEARTAPDPLEGLSAREQEVLGLLLEGMPNKLIALRLGISEKTVEGASDKRLSHNRRHRPGAGGALGRAARAAWRLRALTTGRNGTNLPVAAARVPAHWSDATPPDRPRHGARRDGNPRRRG